MCIRDRMRLKEAAALAVCTDDPGATERVLDAARRVAPRTPIVARARDSAHAGGLLELGADRVVPELLESGLQLGEVMLEEIGYPPAAAREFIEAQRAEYEQRTMDAAHAARRPTN